MRHWSDGKFSSFIGIAKEELSSRQRRPTSVGHKLALPRLRIAREAEIIRVTKSISEAEMFASGLLAIYDCRGGILRANDDGSAVL